MWIFWDIWDTLGYFTRKRKETTFIFRVPEKKRLFYRRGYFKKRKRERKVVSTISATEPTINMKIIKFVFDGRCAWNVTSLKKLLNAV